MHLVRYIHLNPVEANLVQDPKDYHWSSHLQYLKAKNEYWLSVTQPLSFFSDSASKARKAYFNFIKDGIDPKTKTFFNHKKQDPVFGDSDFVDKIKDKFLSNRKDKQSAEITQLRSMRGDLILNRINKIVLKHFRISEAELCLAGRGRRNKPRSVAIALARELSGLGLQEIADYYKLGSYKTVSAHHRRLRQSFAKEKKSFGEFARLREIISK